MNISEKNISKTKQEISQNIGKLFKPCTRRVSYLSKFFKECLPHIYASFLN